MKRAHRSAHRWLWIFLAPMIAYGLYAALQARIDPPVETQGAPELISPLGAGG